ncbi:MAG TPA: L,D-transpeptidase family protein [Acidobacteriota bacterium]|nr:L,D-transpeptidase family protein [Acidobacteriota bacterium]
MSALLGVVVLGTTAPIDAAGTLLSLGDRIRRRIEASGAARQIAADGQLIYAADALPMFYERRAFEPVWITNGRPSAAVDSLMEALGRAEDEGLRSVDYHLESIRALHVAALRPADRWNGLDTASLVDLEMLLTDAFLTYGAHLVGGRVNPRTIDAEWHAKAREVDLVSELEKAVADGRIGTHLRGLTPVQREYALLRRALRKYREIAAAGGWGEVPEGSLIHPGDSDPRVPALRQRLAQSDGLDTAVPATADPVYDEGLQQAVMRFQKRHGLKDDGVVGPKTVVALNVPAAQRAEQVALNMERWRWLPQDLGQRHILVNIAAFETDVVEAGKTVMQMRVIVGKPYRRTPVFSDRMTYLVLNPYWNVPHNITIQDIVPKVRKDPGYLAAQRIHIMQGWQGAPRIVDPSSIDWSQVSQRNFPYWLRQDPGPLNALGRIKFMFPNEFNIYLHDTPKPEQFADEERGFSSGCIRVERSLDLAEYVLRGDPRWSRDALVAALKSDADRTVRLPEPIPVHLLYWTAWVDDEGVVHFRNDIYGRDGPLRDAFREAPPRPSSGSGG